jgi:cysteinyl-tRNA synthetase
MTLRIFNTLTGQKEDFQPLNAGKVGMYVCGITPYDETHLGHGRAYVTFDIVRRYLREKGFAVNFVQNITDIDDKIIARANEQGITIDQLTNKFIASYDEVMAKLQVMPIPEKNRPRATQYIQKMIDLTKQLIANGSAYVVENDVYFSVRKTADYGGLSHRDLEGMESGARVKVDDRKKDPLDFALWKGAKPGEPSWESPWGKGRPGWHTECVVMSLDLLGRPFDIHGGGRDLIFPHHENELAQAKALDNKDFVKYWMHNGFVNVNQEKMSKSLGNFFTLKDIFAKFDPKIVRFFLLQTHYRSPINFSDEALKEAGAAVQKIEKALADLDFYILKKKDEDNSRLEKNMISAFKTQALEAMDDDFNTAGAIAAIYECITYVYENIELLGPKALSEAKEFILGFSDQILGVKFSSSQKAGESAFGGEVESLVKERDAARKAKNFKRSDEIRKTLTEMGVVIEDTPYGTKILKK